jgi:hypothetical protein
VASRDGSVEKKTVLVRMPVALHYIISWYQHDNYIQSFNAAMISLIEGSPEIASRVEMLYTTSKEHRGHLEHPEQSTNAERDDPA